VLEREAGEPGEHQSSSLPNLPAAADERPWFVRPSVLTTRSFGSSALAAGPSVEVEAIRSPFVRQLSLLVQLTRRRLMQQMLI